MRRPPRLPLALRSSGSGRWLAASVLGLALTASCTRAGTQGEGSSAPLSTAPVARTLRVQALVDGTPLRCDGLNGAGDRAFSLTEFMLFLHGFEVRDAAGNTAPVEVVTQSPWQGAGVALIDLSNGTGTCREGTAEVRDTVELLVPAGEWTHLRMVAGVPFALNHADPATLSPPLTNLRMHWGWRGGYKFVRFEGVHGEQGFEVHLGSTGCEGSMMDITGCARPGRAVWEVDWAGETPTLALELGTLLTPALLAGASCMGEDDGSEGPCHAAMSAWGLLPAEGSAAGTDAAPVVVTAATMPWDELPAHCPPPVFPGGTPPTAAMVELGRHLFYDPRLSGDGTLSCAGCHRVNQAFADPRGLSMGITQAFTPRNAMALVNVAWVTRLTWAHPTLSLLEEQARMPLFGTEPIEMGAAGHEDEILGRLHDEPRYASLVPPALSYPVDQLDWDGILAAIAAFQRSLVSCNSPWDRYVAGDRSALSPAAEQGMELFYSERTECFHCHNGFMFSDAITHEAEVPAARAFHNNGLYNLDGSGAYPTHDTGLMMHTGDPADMGRFRAPSLRNVTLTAPYMHDGTVPDLRTALEHYARGGRLIERGRDAGDGAESPLKSEFVPGFLLSEEETEALLAFLKALEDPTIATRPEWQDPWADTAAR